MGALLAPIAAGSQASSQAFGRFGYTTSPEVPGFEVSKAGFRVKHERADTFRFDSDSKLWKPVQTSDTSQTMQLSGIGYGPLKAKFDLYGAGFSLYFSHGVAFRLGSTQAPYLSWKGGSVGAGVPTPKLKWVLVSFRDAQPPVMIASLGEPPAWQISGRPGEWRLKATPQFQGWLRVTAPLGIRAFPANSASALGELTAKAVPLAWALAEPVPRLVRTEITEDEMGISASWVFDRPGAVLPLPLILANLGGHRLRLESSASRIDSSDPSGPISVSTSAQVSARLPVRRIPTGRAVALGATGFEPPGSVSHMDIAGVCELALACLPATRDLQTKELAADVVAKFLSDAPYTVEPNTNLRLPYGALGEGMDLTAAHALLMQSAITSQKANSEENSLLTSVAWRRDWRTWTLWSPDAKASRTAAAIAATAGALCAEPARRLDAAMLEAGLAGMEGLQVWRKRSGFEAGAGTFKAPLQGLRQSLFSYASRPAPAEAFVKSLLSELRVYGDEAVSAEAKDGAVELSWSVESMRPMTLIFSSAYPITVEAKTNIAQFSFENALGFTIVRYTPSARGKCEARVVPPSWAAPLPKAAAPPRDSS